MKQYREALFPMLSSALSRHGIRLTVLYSEPNAVERTKGDNVELPPTLGRKIPGWSFGNHRLLLQVPRLMDITSADLMIVVQATGYLLNYPLLLLSALRLKRVAFWGHGKNLQGNPKSLAERVKRALANSSDWWFAYTRETKRYLESIGVVPDKITAVENAIDTRSFRAELDSVTDQDIAEKKKCLGLPPNSRIALYCGSLYREKRIDYLLEAARYIAEGTPGFRLLIIGAGPESDLVLRAGESHDCIRYVGPVFGRARAVYFRMAEVVLNPGLVGLGILDSFAAGLPLITTVEARHSPEIAYLVDGENGLILSADSRAFGAAVGQLLADPERLGKMRRGARIAGERYTLENMVENMKRGILQSLGIPSVVTPGVSSPK
jgi:glycosyltransferase involved in cell wall biosynthesis